MLSPLADPLMVKIISNKMASGSGGVGDGVTGHILRKELGFPYLNGKRG